MKLPSEAAYEAPRIDSVITEEELEREILYAGTLISQEPTGVFD